MRAGHCSSHGMRKGVAVLVTSGSTHGPSIMSVLVRGDWKAGGKVLHTYFQWDNAGDQHVGRACRGVSYESPEFAALPPHWNVESPMEHPDIRRAMYACFGPILNLKCTLNSLPPEEEENEQNAEEGEEEQEGEEEEEEKESEDEEERDDTPCAIAGSSDCTGPLLLYLASMVHHSSWLTEMSLKCAQLRAIPILQDPAMLAKLTGLVTQQPCHDILQATGVPPHVRQTMMLRELLAKTKETLTTVQSQTAELKDAAHRAVESAMEKAALQMGQVTPQQLQAHTDKIVSQIDARVQQQLASLNLSVGGSSSGSSAGLGTSEDGTAATTTIFHYVGRFWEVPEKWDLPKGISLKSAWRLWLCGSAVEGRGNCRIRPFRKLTAAGLPAGISQPLRQNWRPALSRLENSCGMQIPSVVSDQFIDDSYSAAMVALQQEHGEIWNRGGSGIHMYSVGTWTRKFHEQRKRQRT